MAKTTAVRTNEQMDDRMVSLAKEYTSKIKDMIESISPHLQAIESLELLKQQRAMDFYSFGYIVEMARKMLPVTRDLAQAISQQVEHGSMDNFSKLEIRLKLAELEGSIRALDRMMAHSKIQEYIIKVI